MSIALNGANNTVKKPQIYLIGTTVKGGSYSQQVDNDIHTYASSGLVYESKTQLDEDNILSFGNEVRIIITGQMTPKPLYTRQNGEGSIGDNNLLFQGNMTYNPTIDSVNYYAETWYTLNEKEPVRTSSNFYNFRDMDDSDDLTTLGFVLKLSPTGSPLVTLKARTYFRGEVSKTAIAVFKLIYEVDTNKVYQNTWASS